MHASPAPSSARAPHLFPVLTRNQGVRAAKRGFRIEALPTIVPVDHRGWILSRQEGWSSGSGAALVEQAEKAIEDARKAAGADS